MKVTVVHKNSGIQKKDFPLYDKFYKFLQKELPLKGELKIIFMGEKLERMTTGRRNKGVIRILTKGRLLRDILKTIAHEWSHEFDRTTEKDDENRKIKNKAEAFANSKSGEITTKFEKKEIPQKKDLYKSIPKS